MIENFLTMSRFIAKQGDVRTFTKTTGFLSGFVIAIFFIYAYFDAAMQTDLVVVDDSDNIGSLEDILRIKGAHVMFQTSSPVLKSFHHATSDIERQVILLSLSLS